MVEQVREQGPHPNNTYWDVLRIMHETEFIWFVPNDDNRIGDGLDLRAEYIRDHTDEMFSTDKFGPCSCLEVMVALSRRVAWVVPDGSAEGWAWQLLCNLGLHKFPDPLTSRRETKVRDILQAMIWRNYTPDGVGGFFPLERPYSDQTQVEIWYQMDAYTTEIHPGF